MKKTSIYIRDILAKIYQTSDVIILSIHDETRLVATLSNFDVNCLMSNISFSSLGFLYKIKILARKHDTSGMNFNPNQL